MGKLIEFEPHKVKTKKQGSSKIQLSALKVYGKRKLPLSEDIHQTKRPKRNETLSAEPDNTDLLYSEEKENSFCNFISNDLLFTVIDEIALEGLEGVTIEDLWYILTRKLKNVILSCQAKTVIWHFVRDCDYFDFFVLPESRPSIEVLKQEGYKISPVLNESDRGSCASYKTREECTDKIKGIELSETRTFGSKLVIVAKQDVRTAALMYEESLPNWEFHGLEYVILEHLGKARDIGESTEGKNALVSLARDGQSLFHYQKQLLKNNLITKQLFSSSESYVNCSRLLLLRRFHYHAKPKYMVLAEKITNILRQKPEYRMPYGELRKLFPNDIRSVTKMLKSSTIRKYIKTGVIVKYQEIYPNAKPSEWKRKNSQEKQLVLIQLKNPHANISSEWNVVDDVAVKEEEGVEYEESKQGIPMNCELVNYVFRLIRDSGPNGVSQQEMLKICAVNSTSIRYVMKKLTSRNMLDCVMVDVGKQRHVKYIAKKSETEPMDHQPIETIQTESSFVKELIETQTSRIQKAKKYDIYTPHQEPKTNTPNLILFQTKTPQIPYILPSDHIPTPPQLPLKPPPFKTIRNYSFPLNWKIQTPFQDLNQILTSPLLSNPLPNFNINEDLIIKLSKETNYDIKFILFRAILEKFDIKEALKIEWQPKTELVEKAPLIEAQKNKKDSLNFMGDKPIILADIEINNVNVVVSESERPSRYMSGRYEGVTVTDRMKKRIDLIVESIRQDKIYLELQAVVKIIEAHETAKGILNKIDRKSVIRILTKLVREGYCKVLKIEAKRGNVIRINNIICDIDISIDNPMINSAIDNLAHKVNAVPTNIKKKPVDSDMLSSSKQLRKMGEEMDQVVLTYDKNVNKKYGHRSKYVKTQVMHEFLLYLVYFYPNSNPLTKNKVRDVLESLNVGLSDDDFDKLPTMYREEINWKTFVAPLPKRKNWMPGWVFLCDAIIRMPLSLFVKVHPVNYLCPLLLEYLNHPIKRHFPVSVLPPSINHVLMHRRKYLFSINDVIHRLAFIGLVQFGPHKFKEKDQIFIYLNKNASLMDTTTSEPGYNTVSDKQYEVIKFSFTSKEVMDNYWYSLWRISMNTKLGSRSLVQEQTVLSDVGSKPELKETLQARSMKEALELDRGHIPGDHKGAAGMDSSLWIHLNRNWLNAKRKKVQQGIKQENYDVKEVKISLKKKMVKKGRVKSLKAKSLMKKRLDNVDKMLRIKNGRRRSAWSEEEDTLLFLSKAASFLLNDRRIKQPICFFTIRDVLHQICIKSRNKSSNACRRRWMKNFDSSQKNMNYANLLLDETILKYFGDKEKMKKLSKKEAKIAFVYLMGYISKFPKRFEDMIKGKGLYYDYFGDGGWLDEKDLLEIEEKVQHYFEPRSEVDVQKDIVKSVIHTTLGINKTHQADAYQLFKIYQNYPDNVIRDALKEIQTSSMVSVPKQRIRYMFPTEDKWFTPFRPSVFYVCTQAATFNNTSFKESYKTLIRLQKILPIHSYWLETNLENLNKLRYGQLLAINEICSQFEGFSIKLNVPRRAQILDSSCEDFDQIIDEIARRYLLKLERTNVSENNESVNAEFNNDLDNSEAVQEVIQTDGNDKDEEALDLTVGAEKTKTIDKLKSWISDCVQDTRRSPSPEFLVDLNEDNGNETEVTRKANRSEGAVKAEKMESEDDEGKSSKIPSLEEIRKGILEEDDSDRQIPHVTDLVDLLMKEAWPESPTDEQTLEKFRSNFKPQYPLLDNIEFDLEEFSKSKILKEITDESKKAVWDKVKSNYKVSLSIRNVDIKNGLSNKLYKFLLEKGVLGATGSEIKGKFSDKYAVEEIVSSLEFLLEENFVLQTGICSLRFVCCCYQSSWVLETTSLSLSDKEEISNSDGKDAEEKLNNASKLNIKVMPWTKVDGALNEELLLNWICIVLSNILDNPMVTMSKLCEKFCYLKPVDLFYLLKILEDLGCIEIYTYLNLDSENPFEDDYQLDEVKATILDDFSSMFIECSSTATLGLGQFLYTF